MNSSKSCWASAFQFLISLFLLLDPLTESVLSPAASGVSTENRKSLRHPFETGF